jgi:hypothetical protein
MANASYPFCGTGMYTVYVYACSMLLGMYIGLAGWLDGWVGGYLRRMTGESIESDFLRLPFPSLSFPTSRYTF